MTAEEYMEARNRVLEQLARCAEYLHGRDALIREAARLSIPKAHIARVLGMNRGHVSRIANGQRGTA